jgi:RNA polymerase-binding transcription factor DksA
MISNEKQGLGNLFAESDYSCNIAIEAEAESCRSHASSPDLLHHSASDPLRSIPESQATEKESNSTSSIQLGFRFEERVESSDPSGTQSIEERQFGVCVEASLDILESKGPALPASLIFRPSSLVQLLNSTGIGEVISERQLYRQRKRAPKINSGTKRVDLLAYCAWLHLQRHKPKGQVRRRRVGNLEVITLGELRRILKAQNHRCALTNEILTAENLSLDHIVPLAAGGDFSASNCQLVTAEVNRAKNTMRMSDFIELCKKVALHAERHSVLKNSTQGNPKHE